MKYELHPLCTLFPRMDGKEFASLVEDIKANGQIEPIIMHDGMILDGGNRYRACVDAGVEPSIMMFGGRNPASYVLSVNLHRRHLSGLQAAAIAASASDWSKSHSHGGDRKSDQAVNVPLETVADRRAHSGVSDKTQRMADKIVKADSNLGKALGRGEVSPSDAIEQVTGKRPGAKVKAAQEATATEPPQNEDYDERDATIDLLTDQVDALRAELYAAIAGGESAAAKDMAKTLVADLQKEVKTLSSRLAEITESRNAWQNQVAELKNQINRQRREMDRITGQKTA